MRLNPLFLSKLARDTKLVMPSKVIQTTAESELILILLLDLIQVLKAALVAGGLVVVGSRYSNLLENLQLTKIYD